MIFIYFRDFSNTLENEMVNHINQNFTVGIMNCMTLICETDEFRMVCINLI